MKKPKLNISILSDYICPFCFIGDLRLDVLREAYELKINWCFIEIHPETPITGHSLKKLEYSDRTWKKMMINLLKLAREENIRLSKQSIISNSRKALLLSETCKSLGASVFYPLHQHIFKAYFVEGRDIGDESVLRDIAQQHDIPDFIINQAWDEKYANGPADSVPASLLNYLQYAGALQATSVPCYIIGDEVLNGVITRQQLLAAASHTHKDFA